MNLNGKAYGVLLVCVIVFALFTPVFADGGTSVAGAPSYPIDSTVLTTVDRTINIVPADYSTLPPLLRHDDIANYSAKGYGFWEYNNSGLPYESRFDLMPPGYNKNSVSHTTRLVNFFTITDIHLTDKESPGSAIFFGMFSDVSSGYSPVMLLTPQVFDAAVQTINAQHLKKPFDFGLSLGDAANNNQHNELRWYIDILDGQVINPDSGPKDDPVPGPLNDYQDPFQAAGLNKSIRWYQAIGNHDHFWTGFLNPTEYSRQNLLGVNIINLGNVFEDPAGMNSRGYYMGSINGSTPYGTVFGAGPNSSFPSGPPGVAGADEDRYSLTPSGWMNEFFNTTTSPVGHGFNPSDAAKGFACYSFEPRSDVPIKIIVLDDTQSNSDPVDPSSLGWGHGTLDQTRYEWLVNELDTGQAEGKLMVIACHIPIGVLAAGEDAGWSNLSYRSEDQIIAKLHTYPNFLLWISGHLHMNTVSAFPSPDPSHPELGFWEVQTASLRDYPQQYRTFEIYRNSDDTISIFITDVDPAVRSGSLADKSRSYSVAGQEIFDNQLATLPTGSYNAELVKQVLVSPPVNPDSGGSDSPPPSPVTVMVVNQTVNVGGGSAVTRAHMTGTNLGKTLVVTAMPLITLPASIPAPSTTVFQNIDITTSTIPGVVNQTLLDFKVPQAWLTDHGYSVGDIVMMRYVDKKWQMLDTRYISEKDGNVMYQATIPGISSVAIVYQKGGTLMSPSTPVPDTPVVTTTSLPATRSPVAAITTRQTTKVATPATTAVPAPVTPQPAIPLTTIIAGVIAVIIIIAGALLLKRRQKDELFLK